MRVSKVSCKRLLSVTFMSIFFCKRSSVLSVLIRKTKVKGASPHKASTLPIISTGIFSSELDSGSD